MLKSAFFNLLLICLLHIPGQVMATIQTAMNFWPGNHKECGISLTIEVPAGEYIYKDYLDISIDNPAINLSIEAIKTSTVDHFDTKFHEIKKAFNQDVSIMIGLDSPNFAAIPAANLHVSYYCASQEKIVNEIVPITFNFKNTPAQLEMSLDVPSQNEIETDPSKGSGRTEGENQTPAKATWLSWISDTLQQSNSWAFRIGLIFLLGLLMSLTPCIYPMIPITAGILQTQQSRSLLMSFLLALSYTFGLATTFAILGLLAAFAGQAMGQLMSHPAFIIPLVVLLVYLAFAMMGFYEMYIPRFLQPRDHNVKGGSFLSVFAFGAISGIVASPCLSPGLVCLLCLVTTLGSAFLGFVLLFVFGLGLSVPLLIIGTFSNSLSLLPRAGMWMIEIKKLFGILMLFMCIYFLNYILAPTVLSWIMAGAFFVFGILFLYFARHTHSKAWKFLHTIAGIITIALSIYCTYAAIRTNYLKPMIAVENKWETDYQKARELGKKNNKNVFVDIGAPYCSICKAIDAKIFNDSNVHAYLLKNTIPVKVNGGDAANDYVLQKFHAMGFPTIVLINPETEQEIKRWGPELHDASPDQFVEELKKFL